MWYTLLVLASIFAVWAAGELILWALSAGGLPIREALSVLVGELAQVGVPERFLGMLTYGPHVLLYFAYVGFVRFPPVRSFRTWNGWTRARERWYPTQYENEPEKGDFVDIYAVSPHGVFGAATILAFVLCERFAEVVPVATSLLFWIPGAREFASLAGAVPATAGEITTALDRGRSIVLIPEGLRGLLHADDPLAVLRERRGFIRCALGSAHRARIRLIPVHIEGGNGLYWVYNMWPALQGWLLSRFYYPWPVIALGAWGSFLPRPTPLKVHFGDPIALKEGDDAEGVSGRFCGAMEALIK